jgi:hypothetical protein
MSDHVYAACNAVIMAFISAVLLGSPLGFAAVFAPVNTTRSGLNPLAPRNAFPLKRREPEREARDTGVPFVVPLFVMMLGTART